MASDVAVEMTHKLTLEGTPKPQAHPRLGRNGFFCTPGKKDMAALKAKIKGGINNVPIFGSNQPVVVNIKFFMRRPNTHFKGEPESYNSRLMSLRVKATVFYATATAAL